MSPAAAATPRRQQLRLLQRSLLILAILAPTCHTSPLFATDLLPDATSEAGAEAAAAAAADAVAVAEEEAAEVAAAAGAGEPGNTSREDSLRSRIKGIESVLCHSRAPSLQQFQRFEECNSFLQLVVSTSVSQLFV